MSDYSELNLKYPARQASARQLTPLRERSGTVVFEGLTVVEMAFLNKIVIDTAVAARMCASAQARIFPHLFSNSFASLLD